MIKKHSSRPVQLYRYDNDIAFERAKNIAKRTGTVRYVMLTALGFQIESKRPCKAPYGYSEVRP